MTSVFSSSGRNIRLADRHLRIFEFGQLRCQPAFKQGEIVLGNRRKTNASSPCCVAIYYPAGYAHQAR